MCFLKLFKQLPRTLVESSVEKHFRALTRAMISPISSDPDEAWVIGHLTYILVMSEDMCFTTVRSSLEVFSGLHFTLTG